MTELTAQQTAGQSRVDQATTEQTKFETKMATECATGFTAKTLPTTPTDHQNKMF